MIETLDSGVQFESFADTEVETDDREGALALINKLGLKGQKSLLSGGRLLIPFREFTHEEFMVYRVLCPETTALPDYDLSPIPLRVLEVAEKAASLEVFNTPLQVWHPKQVTRDPVLVGTIGSSPYSRDYRRFMLCRWGAALDEWPALVRQFKERMAARLGSLRRDVERAIAEVNDGGPAAVDDPNPSFSIGGYIHSAIRETPPTKYDAAAIAAAMPKRDSDEVPF